MIHAKMEVLMPFRKLTVPGIVFFLLLSICVAQNQFDFDNAVYIKPVEGSKGRPVSGRLRFDGANKEVQFVPGVFRLDSAKKQMQFVETSGPPALSVKYEAIKGLLYENVAKPRRATALVVPPLVFTKSKSHYLTIDYVDVGGNPQYAIIHLDKDNFQKALTVAESETGKKVERP
jgi:hypothetical protein